MRDLIFFSPFLLLLLAIVFARVTYCRTSSIVWSSTVFTLFFSFGLAVDRIAIPLPTLILLPIALHQLINTPPCVQDSDGCYSEVDPGSELMYFLVFPVFIQWAFWTSIFVFAQNAFFTKHDERPGKSRN